MGNTNKDTETYEIALSQDEVDKLLKTATSQHVKKTLPRETDTKIKTLKEKTKAVAKKMKNSQKKTASKKAAVKKTTTKKAPTKKAPTTKKPAAKKTVNKMSVYFEGKCYGTGTIVTKNGKKIIELLSIRKK